VGPDGKVIGEHLATGVRPLFMEIVEAEGIDLSAEIFAAPRMGRR
jgi:hypothetical protein